jgi:tryptophan synthase alpha subunit
MNFSVLIFSPSHYITEAKGDKAGADGVIIGSKIVGLIEDNLKNKQKCLRRISSFLKDVKSGITQF